MNRQTNRKAFRYGAKGLFKLILLVSILLVGVKVASGHAELEQASPAPGERVESLQTIEMVFSETVTEPEIFLIRDSVQYAVTITDHSDPMRVVGTPQTGLDAGVYQVIWSIGSEDNHRISGSYSFELRPPIEENDTSLAFIGGLGIALSLFIVGILGLLWRIRHKPAQQTL